MTAPATSPTTPAAPSAPSEPTHPCVRCGRPVALDVAMCDTCNPLGLAQPATSQVHGTVLVAIILAVVFLAVAGRVALSGVGPFGGEATAIVPGPGGLAVTLTVRNEGSKAGSTTCRITDAAKNGVGPSEVVQTPRIEPGQSRSFSTVVEQFGPRPVPLAVSCESP